MNLAEEDSARLKKLAGDTAYSRLAGGFLQAAQAEALQGSRRGHGPGRRCRHADVPRRTVVGMAGQMMQAPQQAPPYPPASRRQGFAGGGAGYAPPPAAGGTSAGVPPAAPPQPYPQQAAEEAKPSCATAAQFCEARCAPRGIALARSSVTRAERQLSPSAPAAKRT